MRHFVVIRYRGKVAYRKFPNKCTGGGGVEKPLRAPYTTAETACHSIYHPDKIPDKFQCIFLINTSALCITPKHPTIHKERPKDINDFQSAALFFPEYQITGLHTQKAYTHTGTSSSQCVHQTLCYLLMHIHLSFCLKLMHICNQTSMRTPWCTYWLSNCNSQAYMHEQITKEFEGRKYLYECAPFGYVNL